MCPISCAIVAVLLVSEERPLNPVDTRRTSPRPVYVYQGSPTTPAGRAHARSPQPESAAGRSRTRMLAISMTGFPLASRLDQGHCVLALPVAALTRSPLASRVTVSPQARMFVRWTFPSRRLLFQRLIASCVLVAKAASLQTLIDPLDLSVARFRAIAGMPSPSIAGTAVPRSPASQATSTSGGNASSTVCSASTCRNGDVNSVRTVPTKARKATSASAAFTRWEPCGWLQ